MPEQIECNDCGAVLLKEDLFCGECGAPRPATVRAAEPVEAEAAAVPVAEQAAEPAAVPEAPSKLPVPPAAQPPSSAKAGWRVAFIALVVLAVIACLSGIVVFLILGSTPSEVTTPEQDWLYSAVCCLLPIGGTGVFLAAISGVIWYTRLRER